jgi:hypothetical protein
MLNALQKCTEDEDLEVSCGWGVEGGQRMPLIRIDEKGQGKFFRRNQGQRFDRPRL